MTALLALHLPQKVWQHMLWLQVRQLHSVLRIQNEASSSHITHCPHLSTNRSKHPLYFQAAAQDLPAPVRHFTYCLCKKRGGGLVYAVMAQLPYLPLLPEQQCFDSYAAISPNKSLRPLCFGGVKIALEHLRFETSSNACIPCLMLLKHTFQTCSCAFHCYADDASRQLRAHHFCSHQNEEFRQCILYDRFAGLPLIRSNVVDYGMFSLL